MQLQFCFFFFQLKTTVLCSHCMVEWKCSCFPYMNTSNLLHCRERLNSEVHDQAVEICGSWLSQVSPWFLMGPVTSFHWTKWAASRINTCTGIKREISCLHLDRPANRQPASDHQVHKGAHYICYVHTKGRGGEGSLLRTDVDLKYEYQSIYTTSINLCCALEVQVGSQVWTRLRWCIIHTLCL